MRCIITTGGTGGHIFPALALIEEIKKQDSSSEVLFVGAEYGMEEEICKKASIPFKALKVKGFVGKGLGSIHAGILLILAYFKAKKILKEFKPDAVIGFGGYASAPSILAAKSLKIKIFMHEQNAYAGAVNRYFARFAEKIMLTMPVVQGIYSDEIAKKCILTGNPVRAEIAENAHLIKKDEEKSKKKSLQLLVLGGSLGAHSINSLMISLLDKLAYQNINIRHQCGKKDYAFTKAGYEQANFSTSSLSAFIDDMQSAYEEADIIIARAGATSLAELACMAKACILIPFPFAAHNHQYYNAKTLEDANACILLEEKNMYKDNAIVNENMLLDSISLLATNKEKREELEKNIAEFARPNAASAMYEIITNSHNKAL